ncbi:hypothetical protein CARUB_v10002951mg [Capsella rubella]|uniref:F-box domain-containing protein n=1 Tax=Capsella rubella TaxID=81985 RepID=R0GRW4_9BRAS|nr:hypothetical protein CARUB_v10002951mg [Capsella rubella]
MNLPEDIVINILTRLPLQSIVRFKLVCIEWKLLMGSAYFVDLCRNSNWSIIFYGNYKSEDSKLEEVKLDLPHDGHDGTHHHQSYNLLFSSVSSQSKKKVKEIRVVSCADGLVLLRVKEEEDEMVYYVGNPVIAQWIQLPLSSRPPRNAHTYPSHYSDTGLVTRMRNGALLGYKVVRIKNKSWNRSYFWEWSFEVFSSDTGKWRVVQVSCPGHGVGMCNPSNPVSLNGKLHWLESSRVIVHDFFSCDDQVLRVLPLPRRTQSTEWQRCKRICTTSQGYFVIIDVGYVEEVKSYNVRVMRLNTEFWNWEKVWEINMASVGLGFKCLPIAINFFDSNIIYLWDLDHNCFLACNVRTHKKLCGTRKDVTADKEDTFCHESRYSLLQFVPTLQAIHT